MGFCLVIMVTSWYYLILKELEISMRYSKTSETIVISTLCLMKKDQLNIFAGLIKKWWSFHSSVHQSLMDNSRTHVRTLWCCLCPFILRVEVIMKFFWTICKLDEGLFYNQGTFSLRTSMWSIENINGIVHKWYCAIL